MSTETYPNAPITEAALDIRVRVPKDVTLEMLQRVTDLGYPNMKQRTTMVQLKIEPSSNEPEAPVRHEVSKTPLGFVYRSQDEKQVFQVRSDGFTHNRLAPYTNWNLFSAEARRLWPVYTQIAQPEWIDLLGLNYINQIFIPAGTDFSKYLRIYVEIPPELPQQVNTYSFSFQVNWPGEDGILAHVAQALGPPLKEGFGTIVLSIQAFKNLGRRASDVPEDEIWETFAKLREAKNAVFEACITDEVRKEIR